MHQAVQNVCQPSCIPAFHQDIIDILQDRHLLILVRVFRIKQGFVLMGDPFSGIGFNQRFVQ